MVLLTNRNDIVNVLVTNQPIRIVKTTRCIETCSEKGWFNLHLPMLYCDPFELVPDAKKEMVDISLYFSLIILAVLSKTPEAG